MLAEEVPLDKPVWGVHNDASRGLEAGARFGVRGSGAGRRRANPVTLCDVHGIFFVAASGQIRMAANNHQ